METHFLRKYIHKKIYNIQNLVKEGGSYFRILNFCTIFFESTKACENVFIILELRSPNKTVMRGFPPEIIINYNLVLFNSMFYHTV
jgi:hypothetical protein